MIWIILGMVKIVLTFVQCELVAKGSSFRHESSNGVFVGRSGWGTEHGQSECVVDEPLKSVGVRIVGTLSLASKFLHRLLTS